MPLPVLAPVEPMLSAPEEQIPEGEGWRYEPKWDGFRAIIFRDGKDLHLQSRKLQPLERYFPELVSALRQALPERCVVDGEIILTGPHGLDFEALQLRIHPAASRVAMLAQSTPTRFVAFDLLALGDEKLLEAPFSERRRRLEAWKSTAEVFVTPQTSDPRIAAAWFTQFEGAGLDGVIAKRAELPYQPGERVMVKVKHSRTADCVVGGYRVAKEGGGVGSLLLGLYDDAGALQYVGHTSSFKAKERTQMRELLAPLEGTSSFGEGRTPGGPSRWSQGRETEWVSLAPKLVCEVAFDHMQGDRFRHASRFLRWRVDREPKSCDFSQLRPPRPFSMKDILALTP